MATLTEEQKRECRKNLAWLQQKVDEIFMKHGLPPTELVERTGEHGVRFVRRLNASTTPSGGEKLIKDMSPQEFREKATKMLMETYGYSKEAAEAAVNNPF